MNLFRRVTVSSNSLPGKDENEKTLYFLKAQLEQQHIVVEARSGHLSVTVNNIIIEASISGINKNNGVVVLQLNFTVYHESFIDSFYESTAGVGKTIDEAIINGVVSFIDGILLIIIDAITNRDDERPDFKTSYFGQQLEWRIHLGSMQAQGQEPATGQIHAVIQDIIRERLGCGRYYFIKSYVARQDSGEITVQCLLNGEPIIEAQNALEEYARGWPGGSFKGEKQFFLLRRLGGDDISVNRPQLIKIICSAIEMMGDCKSKREYEQVFDKITERAGSTNLAVELFSLIPEIFCRIIVPDVCWSDSVMLIYPDGRKIQVYLLQFTTFGLLRQTALQLLRKNGVTDKIKALLSQSASFNAINQALHQGSNPKDLKVSSLSISVPIGYIPFG